MIPDEILVVVFKKLSQNSLKEHNENSESEQPITQLICIKNWSAAYMQVLEFIPRKHF
jgi:hypothetical protein